MYSNKLVRMLKVYIYDDKKYVEGYILKYFGYKEVVYMNNYNLYEVSEERLNNMLNSDKDKRIEYQPYYRVLNDNETSLIADLNMGKIKTRTKGRKR